MVRTAGWTDAGLPLDEAISRCAVGGRSAVLCTAIDRDGTLAGPDLELLRTSASNVTGSEDDTRAMMNLLQSLDGIEHVEEVGDLMPHMDDADSSSAGLSENYDRPGRP